MNMGGRTEVEQGILGLSEELIKAGVELNRLIGSLTERNAEDCKQPTEEMGVNPNVFVQIGMNLIDALNILRKATKNVEYGIKQKVV